LTAGLAQRLSAMGASIVPSTTVYELSRHGSHWKVETTTGARLADDVVVAAGAWSAALVRPLGVRLPLVSGKGYSFSVEVPTMPRRPVYLTEAKVGCTPLGQRLRLAGTMELSGIDTRIERHRVDAIARSARPFLGDVAAGARQDEWTGLRPMVPDGLPVIGPAGPEGLWLATGHSMLGVTLGPTTGRVLAEAMAGRPSVELSPFSPARFGTPAGRRAAVPQAAAAE
jgi:D-amino-acid dehydrogenase